MDVCETRSHPVSVTASLFLSRLQSKCVLHGTRPIGRRVARICTAFCRRHSMRHPSAFIHRATRSFFFRSQKTSFFIANQPLLPDFRAKATPSRTFSDVLQSPRALQQRNPKKFFRIHRYYSILIFRLSSIIYRIHSYITLYCLNMRSI